MNEQIKVLDKGFVEFIDSMGHDFTPAEDARISTGSEAKSEKDDINLTRFLIRHKHTTPFEGVICKFKVRAPIMVIREWFRHRTFSYNEESGRYKKLDPLYYVPEISRIKKQSTTNKQGSGDNFTQEESQSFIELWDAQQTVFEAGYERLIDKEGMANELSRLNMPVSHYSTFIVTGNLLNWFRFLQLRMPETAQFEIRQFAHVIADCIKSRFPICYQAFEDYWLKSVTFSAEEMEAIRSALTMKSDFVNWFPSALIKASENKLKGRELTEFKKKLGI